MTLVIQIKKSELMVGFLRHGWIFATTGYYFFCEIFGYFGGLDSHSVIFGEITNHTNLVIWGPRF